MTMIFVEAYLRWDYERFYAAADQMSVAELCELYNDLTDLRVAIDAVVTRKAHGQPVAWCAA
jgi:hypothetical protein